MKIDLKMDIRQFLFRHRSYTPVPLLIAILVLANPTWISFAVGIAIALTGELLRLWGVSYAGSATRTTGEVGGDELITSGPFAHVRNPLYLGNFLLTCGFCIAAWAWMPWMLLLAIGLFAFQYGLIISLEEDFLQEKFGEAYQKYYQQVPRLIPRCRSYPFHQNRKPDLKKALRSERSTFISFGLVTLVILLRWQVLG
ncbi:hypothetical protein B5M50_03950 [candidate division KSB1 bacterium 4484_219]|nr:MAG: hypothetical protein B5M50_03950 [candidate division KSB1 bacterium 4484_219]